MNIVVIGAGTMGNGIAHLCAQHGHSVSLVDISEASLSKGIATITGNLDRQVKKEVISNDDKHAILGRINASTDLSRLHCFSRHKQQQSLNVYLLRTLLRFP